MKRYAIVSLGCSRNMVDSEVIAGDLKAHGFKPGDPEKGVDLYIVNTCAFIDSARRESVDAIMEASALKESGKVGRIAVCGCLPQMYKGKLSGALPEVDILVGSSDFPRLAEALRRGRSRRRTMMVSDGPDYLYDGSGPRSLMTPGHYAYLKISEGCSNLCSYCVISKLRGRFRSRSVESVVSEAGRLSRGGRLKELILVGQDTTLFGIDRYGRAMLPDLLKKLSAMAGAAPWIRLMYTHPAHFSDELISAIADTGRICRYVDLPIQHINDRILRMMNRNTTKRGISDLIARLRKAVPGIALRTSIITGFPGETDRQFRELLDFIRETRFERLGAFVYSREPGTRASRFPGQVPEAVKKERHDAIMRAQQELSLERNRSLVGKRVRVLIDEKEPSGGSYAGRTEADAPEVDGTVYVSGKNVRVGEFCDVRITDAMEYDLVGEIKPDKVRR